MVDTPEGAGRHLADLEFLSEVTRETLASVKLDTILSRVASLLRDRFGYDYAAVALVEANRVVLRAGSGGDEEDDEGAAGEAQGGYIWRIPVGRGIVGTAVATGKPRLVNQVEQDPDYIRANFLSQTQAELAVPLIHHDQVLGVLDVQSHAADAFDQYDVRLLQVVGALVAPAVHIAALYQRERRRSQHLQLVSEMSRLVMSTLDRSTVINVACEAILKAMGISFAAVALVDPGPGRVVHSGHASTVPLLPEVKLDVALGRGVVGRVADTGQPVRISDVSFYPDFIHVVPGMRSALCVPLQVRDGVVGVVDVEHTEADFFTVEDEHLLTSLAAYMAQAMENARLFEEQQRRWQQLLLINEMARNATESFDLERVTTMVAREIHDRFNYFAVAVLLTEEEHVVVRALACDLPLEVGLDHRAPLGTGAAGTVAQTGEVFQAGSRAYFDAEAGLRPDTQSILAVPLRAPGKVIGAIQVESRRAQAFDSDDRMLMETLAKSVAGAIDNAISVRQTDQFRDDFTRMIVHDLRNPVHALMLTLQEVQRTGQGQLAADVLQDVELAISRSEDIQAMVSSLLDVSRFEADKVTLRISPAVLNDHIRQVVRRISPLAKHKQIEIETELSPDVPVVQFDQDLMGRTLDNLIGNAVKFTPHGGRVTIRSALCVKRRQGCPDEPPFVLVTVADTGEGIPAEYHHKIFDKFGQVETRQAGLKMSTGLGLAHSRHVVEAHGGSIWVDSEPGQGAAFSFTLPVTARPRRPSEEVG